METPFFDRLRWRTFSQRVFRPHFTFLFILALVIGMGIKVLIRDRVTIGYDDYTLPPVDTLVDLNALEKELIKQGAPKHEPTPRGDTCSKEE